jgi:hypothetical protein
MPRYFFGENAGRPVRAGAREFAFDIIGIAAGTHQGIVKIEDHEADIFLSVAARWVTEIPEQEYNQLVEKKKRPTHLERIRDSQPQARLGPPLKGRGAVVVDGSTIVKPAPEKSPTSIDDAIVIGKGDSIPSEQSQRPTTRRENHRQKRGFEE